MRAHRPGRAPSRLPYLSASPPPPIAAGAAMGLTISSLFSRLFGKKQMRILMGEGHLGARTAGATQPSAAEREKGGRGKGCGSRRGNRPVPGCGARIPRYACPMGWAGGRWESGGEGRGCGSGCVCPSSILPVCPFLSLPRSLPLSPAGHGEAEPPFPPLRRAARGTKMELRPGRAGVPGRGAERAPRPGRALLLCHCGSASRM